MSAAQEHLQTVKTAQAHSQELGSALENLKSGVEEAVAAIVAVCNTVTERAAAAGNLADQLHEAANATLTTGEAHMQAAQNAGHGTLAYANAAYQECSAAHMNAAGILDMLQQMQALLAEVKEQAATPFITASANAETITGGIAMVNGLLESAEEQIQHAINL